MLHHQKKYEVNEKLTKELKEINLKDQLLLGADVSKNIYQISRKLVLVRNCNER